MKKTQTLSFLLFLSLTTIASAAPTTGSGNGSGVSTAQSSGRSISDESVGTHAVGVGAGQVILMGDFAKNYSDSFGFNLYYDYEVSDMFGLLVSGLYSSHGNNRATDELSIRGLIPNLKINLAYFDKLVVSSLIGLGMYSVSEKLGDRSGSAFTFGFNLGAGLSLQVSQHVRFGTNLTFNNIFSKSDPSSSASGSPALSIGGTYVGLLLSTMYVF